MRSQTLLAQKPKRVGQLANVGAKLVMKLPNFSATFYCLTTFLLGFPSSPPSRADGAWREGEWGDSYTQGSRPVLSFLYFATKHRKPVLL